MNTLSPQEVANLLRQPHPGLFCQYQPLVGRDWLRRITPEDRRVFANIGAEAHEHGVLGGIARANTARRDERGRFLPKPPTDEELAKANNLMWDKRAIYNARLRMAQLLGTFTIEQVEQAGEEYKDASRQYQILRRNAGLPYILAEE